ncbi:hypothetical protein BAE44_0000367 [Dichanthelium oligosanthes]|uniref:MATH domain-containing protein n=1 Tax=Dichanthelium oligosanthes TaxID=888268 RepID=A0A1E5WML1_9POAL|nr:hypothetical protein BAE44_0000367 [Dichanthelium oligosanthes]
MAGHTTSASVVEKAHGTHRFKIIGYKQNICNLPIRSGRFNIGGYDWKLVYHPRSHNHDELDDDYYIEVGIELLSSARQEVKVTIDLHFINQTTNVPYSAVASDEVIFRVTNEWESTITVIKRSELEKMA